MRVRRGLIGFIAVLQSVLFLSHFLLYETWIYPGGSATPLADLLKPVLAVLSISFVAASLLAFRYTNSLVRTFYRIAAIWLGLLTFLFFAALSAWLIFAMSRAAGLNINFHLLAEVLFGIAFATGLYGVF